MPEDPIHDNEAGQSTKETQARTPQSVTEHADRTREQSKPDNTESETHNHKKITRCRKCARWLTTQNLYQHPFPAFSSLLPPNTASASLEAESVRIFGMKCA